MTIVRCSIGYLQPPAPFKLLGGVRKASRERAAAVASASWASFSEGCLHDLEWYALLFLQGH
jgi:hypothetical protein